MTEPNPDRALKQPGDRTRVNVHEEWELTYWTKLLGVDETDLRKAVEEVGEDTEAIRAHLGKRYTQK